MKETDIRYGCQLYAYDSVVLIMIGIWWHVGAVSYEQVPKSTMPTCIDSACKKQFCALRVKLSLHVLTHSFQNY